MMATLKRHARFSVENEIDAEKRQRNKVVEVLSCFINQQNIGMTNLKRTTNTILIVNLPMLRTRFHLFKCEDQDLNKVCPFTECNRNNQNVDQ